MHRPRILSFLAAATLALAVGCGNCGKGGERPIGQEPVTATVDENGRKLEPLPAPPKIDVVPEAASGEFRVVAARPKGEIRGDVRPTVTFSKPVKALGEIETGKEPAPARIEPALAGEWKWLGSASVEFVPKDPVPYATPYKVTVLKGLRALDGSTLKEDFTFEFSTPRPELQDAHPVSGYGWLMPEEPLKLLFNQPVKDSDLLAALTLTVGDDAKPWKAQVMARVSIAEERRQERIKRAKDQGMPVPPEPEEGTAKNRQVRYTLAPEKPFPLNAPVKLVISPTLRGEQGPLTLGKAVELQWRTYGPLAIREVSMCLDREQCAHGPLVIKATNRVDVESLKNKLQITPKVAIDWDHAESWAPASEDPGTGGPGPYVSLPGKFKPGTRYQVQIAAGVQDEFKQTSAASFSARVRTTDLRPQLHSGGEVALVEAASGPKLPVEVVNLKTLNVGLWKLTPSEAAPLLADRGSSRERHPSRAADSSEIVQLGYAHNEARVHGADLSPALPDGRGLALVELDSPDLPDRPRDGVSARTFVQVTDLAVHLKVAPKRSLAWVTRLSDGAGVADADVALYDKQGQQLWTGKTDAQGLADIPGAAELKLPQVKNAWERPFVMAAATLGNDTGVSTDTWDEGLEPWFFDGISQGWDGTQPQPSGFIFTDRGIYRPGDKVFIKGVARYWKLGALQAPAPGSTLQLTVTNSRNEKVTTQALKLSRFGTFNAALDIPKDTPTGYFSIAAKGDAPGGPLSFDGSFRVEEYRAPQFRVDVKPAKSELIAGEPIQAQVNARYLFGGAMSDAQVKWSVNMESTSFTPEGASGFSFEQETWWYDDNHPRPNGGFFASGEGRVNAQGLYELKAGETQAPGEKPWTYVVEAEVTDVNRQAVADRKSVTVHPAAYYVGLRGPTGFPQVGKTASVDALVVDPSGKRVAGRKVDVAISLRTWKSVRQKDASGGFTTVSEPVEEKVSTCQLTSVADGPASCQFKPASPGFYIVKATVEDDQKRKHSASLGLYAVGPGFVAWQRDDTNRVPLQADKKSYDVGDVAKVLIKSPWPKARGLLTVEREGVIERRVLDLEGSATTADIPISEGMVPNVYAGVVLMRPRVQGAKGAETDEDPGRPQAAVGYVKLAVEKKSKRLTVSVKPEREEYRPGEEVSVALEVKDAAGKGAPAELTVFAVDESVLRLTSYQTPDPLGAIFPDRPLSVVLGEPLIHLVRRRTYGEKGEDQGGGGGEGGEGKGIRSNFKTTAIFNPAVETDADGRAKVRFKLPDNLTTFRVMAVAVTAADRFGSGDASIKVNKPLLALPALPRFARVGDTFEAGVVVHSYGDGKGEVTVTAEVKGVRLTGAAQQKVDVTAQAPKEVRFPFTADAPGTATFVFRVQRGADQDGVQEKIPIELPVSLEAVATAGDTKDQRVEAVAPPSGARPGLGGLEVTMSSTAMGNFQEGMRQLVDYPYGCLEQQASRLVPFVALREIAGQFGLPWPSQGQEKQEEAQAVNALLRMLMTDPLDVSAEQDPDKVISATVRSIMKLQDPDGGFRYWSDSQCASSWASTYATLALTRARQVGFDVEPEKLSRAQAYLAKVAGGNCGCEHECPLETRAFATYVLARGGKPRPSYYGEFFKKRDQLSLFTRALLADAMFVGGGDKAQARTVLDEVLNYAKESPRGVHIEEVQGQTYAALWQSDTRTTGVVLQTLTDISPEHPYVAKMAHYLADVRRKDGSWRTTQEAAFSLMALAEVVRTKEQETPDFTAKVALGGQTLFEQPFKGRSMEVKEKKLSLDELLKASGGKEQKLVFKKEGTGVLYYSALLRYAPTELPMTPLDRGLYVQRWFEPFSGGGQATTFFAGELVRVRVRVGTAQERHFAVFEVPLPAGLEPVDTSLATTAALRHAPDEESREGYNYENADDQESGTAEGGEGEGQANPWAYAFYSPFNHVERRDTRVVLFADHLPPGVHLATFVARATTPGKYLLKPAHGELMYEPEVFGRSGGGTLEVALPKTVTQRE